MNTPAAPLLEDLQPMDACRASEPFRDPDWVFELEAGGARVLAEAANGQVRLRSLRGVEVAARFPEVRDAMAGLMRARTVVDAELCVVDTAGRHDPLRLQERSVRGEAAAADHPVSCWVRDLLVWDGHDVRSLAWWRRRALLRRLKLEGTLRLAPVCPGDGLWLHRQAQALGRAGIHARRIHSAYAAGRSADWLWIASSS